MDQARDHAAGPGAGVHVALEHDPRIDARDLLDDVLELEVGRALLALVSSSRSTAALFSTRSVLRSGRITRRVSSSEAATMRLLHVLVHRRLLRRDEARAHVHAVGAHAPARPPGCARRPCRRRRRTESSSSSAARGSRMKFGMSSSPGWPPHSKPSTEHRVAADRLGLQRVAHGGALVDHLDAGVLERGQYSCGVVARRSRRP